MSTTKPRINISVSEELNKTIARLAKRDNMPTATKAARLIEVGLENEEDEVLNTVAQQRDKTSTKFYTHDEVFKP